MKHFYSPLECASDHDYDDQFEPECEQEPDIYDWHDDEPCNGEVIWEVQQ